VLGGVDGDDHIVRVLGSQELDHHVRFLPAYIHDMRKRDVPHAALT
jgi:hypothetical protein